MEKHLASRKSEEHDPLSDDLLFNPDVLLALCEQLRHERDSAPGMVAEESVGTFERISARAKFGLFDERDFFLGEFAFLAGGAFRLMGKRDEALDWLSR
ncbi:MAG: hypothetical protein M3R62_07525, partial [Acidobacteriota bacterium]|nr:hypothetical protein [Acidobacteriota bacterium]